uniref:Ciliary neurotrophic factor receptor subunit alpha isoform X3 n=1 Tax=Pogona vitticeps TaxID=103695 RepID=A0ABM5FUQ4_9SAUR
MHLPAESLFGTTPSQRIIRSQHFTASTEPGSYRFCPSHECQGRCSRLAPSPSTRFLATSADLHPVPEAMASPVPAGCCVLLAAVVVVVYAQRPSQQETHIHYAQLGTDVTLLCGSVDQDAAVTWTANSTDLDASHLNGSRLVLRNVDLSHSGQYTCYEGPSWHVKYRVNLRVGLPPKEPIVMCRSNNYPNGFYCSWHLPSPTYINDTFNITVVHDSKEIVCKKEMPPKNRCYIQFLQVFSTKKYKVTLTASNPLGSSSTTISFDEFAIAGPSRECGRQAGAQQRPEAAGVLAVSVLVARPRLLPAQVLLEVELSDGTSHIITDAYAGKEYIIQVAAKDNDIGTWSDWSVAVHATPWTEEPKHLTTEAQGAETTTASTSAFVVPPTTRLSDSDVTDRNRAMALSLVVSLVLVVFSIHFI